MRLFEPATESPIPYIRPGFFTLPSVQIDQRLQNVRSMIWQIPPIPDSPVEIKF